MVHWEEAISARRRSLSGRDGDHKALKTVPDKARSSPIATKVSRAAVAANSYECDTHVLPI
jgi:hypothetical protein